ncbi:MAG: hypothetical protein AAF433_10170 [Bacteroidota bacterium]
MRLSIVLLFLGGLALRLSGQVDSIPPEQSLPLPPCAILADEIDPFDSLRTVTSDQMELGAYMVSQYETADGPRLVSEAKAAVLYSENDSLSVLFMHLEMPEYEVQNTDNGFNLKFKMASDTIVGFYTVTDRGTFSRTTNMRHYQHTALVPIDLYYLLTTDLVELLRVEYGDSFRRTILLTPEQRVQLREHFRCVGERVGYYPVAP